MPLDSYRYLRAASVGPTSYSYMLRDYSAMPFTYAARQCAARAASMEPVTTYSRAYYDSSQINTQILIIK